MNRRVLYPAGMLGIIVICIILGLLGAWSGLPQPGDGNFGLALPSPNLWMSRSAGSQVLNILGIGICAILLYFINKQFSLIKTGQPLGASFFLPLTFANLPLGGQWTSLPCVTLIALIIYATLFNAYRARNATRQLFVIATCLSIGSMFEYAFIPLGIAAFIAAFLMEIMRPKEFLAMGLGLIAPYWVAIGFGLIDFSQLQLPHPHTIFSGNLPDETIQMISVAGIMALCAIMLSLYNGMILYAGNSRVRRSILVMNTFGLVATISMFLDLNNLPAYMGVFNIWFAIQLANFFTLRELRRGGLLYWLLQLIIVSVSLIYISSY